MAAGTQIGIDFIGKEQDAARAIAKLEREVAKLRGTLKDTGVAGKSAGKEVETGFQQAANSVTSMIAGMVSVGAAVQTATAAWQTMTANIRETAEVAAKAASAMRGFAASQVGDANSRTRMIQASGLLIQHGVTREDRGPALDLLQSLQDAMGGNAKRAFKETDELLILRELGMSTESLKDIGMMAAARGGDPGELARKAFEAGEATGVGPSTIAKLMPAVDLFKNTDEGLAIASVLAANLGDRKARAGMEAVSQALGPNAPEKFRAKLKKYRIEPGASPLEAIETLAERGIDTVEEFQGLGMTEPGHALALSILARDRAKVRELVKSLPILSTEERSSARLSEIESQNPEMLLERQNRRILARTQFDQEIGPPAVEALRFQQSDLIRGQAFRATGHEQILGFDLIDKEGRSSSWDMFLLGLFGGPGAVDDVAKEIRRAKVNSFVESEPDTPAGDGWLKRAYNARGADDPAAKAMNTFIAKIDGWVGEWTKAARSQTKGAERMNGGPALIPATVDR